MCPLTFRKDERGVLPRLAGSGRHHQPIVQGMEGNIQLHIQKQQKLLPSISIYQGPPQQALDRVGMLQTKNVYLLFLTTHGEHLLLARIRLVALYKCSKSRDPDLGIGNNVREESTLPESFLYQIGKPVGDTCLESACNRKFELPCAGAPDNSSTERCACLNY